MLDINTFDARQGGNALYKALAHPLAAEAAADLAATLRGMQPFAAYDPDDIADALWAMHPQLPRPAEAYVHDVQRIGQPCAGLPALPLAGLPRSPCRALLVTSFEAGRVLARIRHMLPEGMRGDGGGGGTAGESATVLTLDALRLPEAMLTQPRRYLDKLNFATNWVFFRDRAGLHTRLVTANYWSGYGARQVQLWVRLHAEDGTMLAEWTQALPPGAAGITIDSREVRARFDLPEFTGQLFLHAVGVAGHDVIKYALDTYGSDGDPSLSCTHDANAWPSARYAGLPAPREGERVILWLQNSHAAPIPAGAVELDQMGAETPVPLSREVGPYATVPLDVETLLPGLRWPSQIEIRAGRHVVRPRYEVVQDGRTRIAHVNVERADLKPDPGIKSLHNLLGRGYLLPFPVLPADRFRTIVQPTPMAESQQTLPLRLDVFAPDGRKVAERYLGCLPRLFDLDLDLRDLGAESGHAELAYDFRDGGDADGWMHCLVRYEDRTSGHAAETSFGAHIYNTAMTYRDEPQSYSGPPPGLSTRLFLRLGEGDRRSFAHLIYAASAPWHPWSDTVLALHDESGAPIAERPLRIACCGSAMVFPHEAFGDALLAQAGPRGYVMVRDATCRLFGYHGLMDGQGAFSLDHMFGF